MPQANNRYMDIGTAIETVSKVILPFNMAHDALPTFKMSEKAAVRTKLHFADLVYAANHITNPSVMAKIEADIKSRDMDVDSTTHEFNPNKAYKPGETAGVTARKAVAKFFNDWRQLGINGDTIKNALISMSVNGAYAPNGIDARDSVHATNETVHYLHELKTVLKYAKFDMKQDLSVFSGVKLDESDVYLYLIASLTNDDYMKLTKVKQMADGVDASGKPTTKEVNTVIDTFTNIMNRLGNAYVRNTGISDNITGADSTQYVPMNVNDDTHNILGASVTANCFVPMFAVDVNSLSNVGNAHDGAIMIIDALLGGNDSFNRAKVSESADAINSYVGQLSKQASTVEATRNALLSKYYSNKGTLLNNAISACGLSDEKEIQDFYTDVSNIILRKFFYVTSQSGTVHSGKNVFKHASALYTVNGTNNVSRERQTEVAEGNINTNAIEVAKHVSATVTKVTDASYTVHFSDTNSDVVFAKNGGDGEDATSFIKPNMVVRKDTNNSNQVYCIWSGVTVYDKVSDEGFEHELYQSDETRAARMDDMDRTKQLAGDLPEKLNSGVVNLGFQKINFRNPNDDTPEMRRELAKSLANVDMSAVIEHLRGIIDDGKALAAKVGKSSALNDTFAETGDYYKDVFTNPTYWFNTAHPDMNGDELYQMLAANGVKTYESEGGDQGDALIKNLNQLLSRVYGNGTETDTLSHLTGNGHAFDTLFKYVSGPKSVGQFARVVAEGNKDDVNYLTNLTNIASEAGKAYGRSDAAAAGLSAMDDERLNTNPSATAYDYGAGVPQPADFKSEQADALNDLPSTSHEDYAKITNSMPKNFDEFDIDSHETFGNAAPTLGMSHIKCGNGVNAFDDLDSTETLANRGLSVSNMETLAHALDDAHQIVKEIETRGGDNTVTVMEHTGENAVYKLIDMFYPLLGEPATKNLNITNWIQATDDILNDARRQASSLIVNGSLVELREKVLDVLNNIEVKKLGPNNQTVPNIDDVSTILANVVLYLYNSVDEHDLPNDTTGMSRASINTAATANDLGDYARMRGAFKDNDQRGTTGVDEREKDTQFVRRVSSAIADNADLVRDLNNLYNSYGRGNTEGDKSSYDRFAAIQKAASNKTDRIIDGSIRGSFAKNAFSSEFYSRIITDEANNDANYSAVRDLLNAVSSGQPTSTNTAMHTGLKGDITPKDTMDVSFDKDGNIAGTGDSLDLNQIVAILGLNEGMERANGEVESYFNVVSEKYGSDPVKALVIAARLKMVMTLINHDKSFTEQSRSNPEMYKSIVNLYRTYAFKICGHHSFTPYITLFATLDPYTLNMGHEIDTRNGAARVSALTHAGDMRASELGYNELMHMDAEDAKDDAKVMLNRMTKDTNNIASDYVNDIIDALVHSVNDAAGARKTIGGIIGDEAATKVLAEFNDKLPSTIGNDPAHDRSVLRNIAGRFVNTMLRTPSVMRSGLNSSLATQGSNIAANRNAKLATKGAIPRNGHNIADNGTFTQWQERAANIIAELPVGNIDDDTEIRLSNELDKIGIGTPRTFIDNFNDMCKAFMLAELTELNNRKDSGTQQIQKQIGSIVSNIAELYDVPETEVASMTSTVKLPKAIDGMVKDSLSSASPEAFGISDIKKIIANYFAMRRDSYDPNAINAMMGAPSQITATKSRIDEDTVVMLMDKMSHMKYGFTKVDDKKYILPDDPSNTPTPMNELRIRLQSAMDEFEKTNGRPLNVNDDADVEYLAKNFTMLAKPIVNYKTSTSLLTAVVSSLLCGKIGGKRGPGVSFMNESGSHKFIKHKIVLKNLGMCDAEIDRAAVFSAVYRKLNSIMFPSSKDGDTMTGMTSENINWSAEMNQFAKFTKQYITDINNEDESGSLLDNGLRTVTSHLYDLYASTRQSLDEKIKSLVAAFIRDYANNKITTIPKYYDGPVDSKKTEKAHVRLINFVINGVRSAASPAPEKPSAPSEKTAPAQPTVTGASKGTANNGYRITTDKDGQMGFDFTDDEDVDLDDEDESMPEVHGAND